MKTGLTFEPFLGNRLLETYTKCNAIECAQKVFDDLRIKNSYSRNVLLSWYLPCGRLDQPCYPFDKIPKPILVSCNSLIILVYPESISVLKEMQIVYNHVFIHKYAIVSVMGACACSGALALLCQVHGLAIVIGIDLKLESNY
ncbi:hypothetical protein SLA2020_002600 [Shorea laevis]